MEHKSGIVPSLVDREVAASIAASHGVDAGTINPPNSTERLRRLRKILDRTDVPHAIDRAKARECFQMAQSGKLFGIGMLSGETVDLTHYENHQDYDSLTGDDHLSWACLVADQQTAKHRYACREYLHGEEMFEIGGNVIPDYYLLNARIYQQTGWQLATVSEIIPAEVFFHCHSHKFFPVTTFMRPLGTDYLEEPDVGHDVAGHVATFTIPEVAQVMNNHGLANDLIHHEKEQKLAAASSEDETRRILQEANELLLFAGRLYWFTVEFGLVMQGSEFRAFGAGILSSPGETKYSIESPSSNRVLIDPSDNRDLLRLATTDYLISEYQKTYFVMKNFETLASLTPQRILHVVHTAQDLPHHTWREIVPGDQVVNVGQTMTSPNEKYYRLLAGQSLDKCLYRTAIRNLRMHVGESPWQTPEEMEFVNALPPIPPELIDQFSRADEAGEFVLP